MEGAFKPGPANGQHRQLEEAILNVGEVQGNKASVNVGRGLREACAFFAQPTCSVRWSSPVPPSSCELGQQRLLRRLDGLYGSRA